MNNEKDPLAQLFTNDAKSTDREQLVKLVSPFIIIDKETGEFSFLPKFAELSGNLAKIQILLAGAKARSLYLNQPDGLLPGEIISVDIMPAGSVKSSIKKLFDKHDIKKDKDGRYFLPGFRISVLIDQFIN